MAYELTTAGKAVLALLAAGAAYAVFGPKPRFLGDKLRKGDRAGVALSSAPELAAALPPEAVSLVARVDTLARDAFDGPIVGARTTAGEIPLPAEAGPVLAALGSRTFPRAAVTSITRNGSAVTL